ncbi:hypothetical protein FRC04_008679 [Tulasnella sp. 424]|nr:hypothetical protein FRC04_008679 [Tulasnella sp. 424]KAG8979912.1 hypothetical protein FRC05_007355 [Tulasnella sp. 425]
MSLSYTDTVVAICEFLEATFHTILCLRQVYPYQVFVRRKKYDAPVFQSRSPSLNEYISSCVKSIGQELLSSNVRSVVLVIKDKSDVALERFVFTVNTVIGIDSQHQDTPIPDAMTQEDLQQQFRSFLVKLGSAEAQMLGKHDDQDELSFSVVLEMKDGNVPTSVPNEQDPVPWVPAVAQHTSDGTSDEAELYMVKAVETGIVNFSLAIQESEEKIQRSKSRASKGKERLEQP